MERIVVALGGNALGDSPAAQLEAVGTAASALFDLREAGYNVVVAHGNGPQVGIISNALDLATEAHLIPAGFDLPEASAMSQGYIGYHLAQALGNEARHRGADQLVVQVTTQVVVDANDPGFAHPTKPVGPFFSEEEARELMASNSMLAMVEDAGRGWRRVVASPKPREIVEAEAIAALADTGTIVIACGGGGVPLIREGEDLHGVPAVIDKDFCAALLADQLNAQTLIIMTAVDKVALNFGTPEQRDLDTLELAEVDRLIEEGHFAAGSMLPKIEAAAQFVASGNGRKAIICDLRKVKEALSGNGGTHVVA